MTSIKRKILLYVFILIFVITTPLITLYATGYKIDLNDPTNLQFIQKTGMILLETEPEQAKIFIDDKVQKPFFKNLLADEERFIETPAKIKGLLPGEYLVRLELDGYWPWTKKIKINSGQITHLQNIKLFRKTLPLLISSSEVQDISTCQNKKMAYLPENGILVDLKNETEKQIATSTASDVCWSSDNKKLLINNNIYNIKDPKRNADLQELLGDNAKNIRWDKNNPNKLFYQHRNSINYFDLGSQRNKTIVDGEEYLDYIFKEGHLLYISTDDKVVRLKVHSSAENRAIKEIELPFSDGYQFIPENSGNLTNILDNNYQILYIIDHFSFLSPLEEIVNNVKYFDWTENETLFYANDFEIWKLNFITGERKIITRISEPIKSITATTDQSHLIYSTEQSIKVIELGRQEKLFSTELIKLDKISAPILSEDEKNIYFTAQIGNQKGLYKLKIK